MFLTQKKLQGVSEIVYSNHMLKLIEIMSFIKNKTEGTTFSDGFNTLDDTALFHSSQKTKEIRKLKQAQSEKEKSEKKSKKLQNVPKKDEVLKITKQAFDHFASKNRNFQNDRNTTLALLSCHVPIRLEPYLNLKIKNVLNAEKNNETFILKIQGTHKTSNKYGNAQPGVPNEIFQILKKFVQIHKETFKEKEEIWHEMPVFCAKNGTNLTVGCLSNIITNLFQDWVGRKITATEMRAFQSTRAQLRGESGSALSQSFLHSAKTAENEYFRAEVGTHVFTKNYENLTANIPTKKSTKTSRFYTYELQDESNVKVELPPKRKRQKINRLNA